MHRFLDEIRAGSIYSRGNLSYQMQSLLSRLQVFINHLSHGLEALSSQMFVLH